MTTTIAYTCDICKQAAKSRHENGGYPPLWIVSITCMPIDERHQYIEPTRYQHTEMCNDCVKRLGIHKPLLAADIEAKPPTIEDMIREIVRSEQEREE